MNVSFYQNSLLILMISAVLIIPLIIFKGYSKYSIPLFYVAVIAATLFRPTIQGTDNSNNILALEQFANYGADAFKYSLIYYLTFLIPGTWQKLLFLNLLSSSIIIFSLNKIFKQIKYKSNLKYIYLLYMSYFIQLGSILLLVHLRQYLSFSLTVLLLVFYRSKRRSDIFFELFLSFLIFFIHPSYIYFSFFYFTCKYFLKNISYLIKNTNFLTWVFILIGLLYPCYLIYQNLDKIFIDVAFLLPGFDRYGLDVGKPASIGIYSLISRFYPIILIFPLILLKMFGTSNINKNKTNSLQFFSIFIIFLIFCTPLIVLAFKASNLYSIDRIKSIIYPAVFILLFHLEEQQLNKRSTLIISASSIFISLSTMYRIYNLL